MTLPYRNSTLSISERVDDLISRMTIAEKIGQLMQIDGRLDLKVMIEEKMVGSILHINGSQADAAIKRAARTRLGIPLLLADDGIHGHSFWSGATIFPTQLGMACSWDTDLLEKVARVTANEMRCTGLTWTFSPVLCTARDLRWGRVGETFGEDPHLIGELACAMIRGYQGNGLHDPDAVLATAKHYAGYSETQGGRDASEADISRRKLLSWLIPPFEKAAKNGCMAFMTGYQSMDGVPSTASHWLLTEVLKDSWGFDGILVTDWDNVGRLVWKQKVCKDMAEAAAIAVKSGNDMMMSTPTFFEGAHEALERGLMTVDDIDAPVRRVLGLKFKLGLFENPGFSDQEKISRIIACAEHKNLNLEMARASLVLLRNNNDDDGIPLLPLQQKDSRKICIIGPNADDMIAQLGDWSLGSGQMDASKTAHHPSETVVTVLDGFRNIAPPNYSITHSRGCSIVNSDESGIDDAVRLAQESDYVVLVLGDRIEYVGETKSTATLEFMGAQKILAQAVVHTGKPVILVLINSKPLVLPECILGDAQKSGVAVIMQAFNPGMQGGTAIAEIVFGMINPCGKLPISMPLHVGQQPVYYNQIRGQNGTCYADLSQEPAFSFGFGLSYTNFVYSQLKVFTPYIKLVHDKTSNGAHLEQRAHARIHVENAGDRDGDEIIQVYVEDVVTSATWAVKELKAFKKVHIPAQSGIDVDFLLDGECFSIVNSQAQRVIEPGEFRIHVGPSSRAVDVLSDDLVIVE